MVKVLRCCVETWPPWPLLYPLEGKWEGPPPSATLAVGLVIPPPLSLGIHAPRSQGLSPPTPPFTRGRAHALEVDAA